MNTKSNKFTWNLDNPLDLSRNKISIDNQFRYFSKKNSPMYNESISPLYTKTSSSDTRIVYNTNGDKFTYKNGVLYMNDISIMETGGNGYFTRLETNHDDYDTYDIDDNDNELYSKYENGKIKYHTPNGDYEYTLADPFSVIIDCRARIVNGTPIIAYIFANSSNTYDYVYLRDNVKYSPQFHSLYNSKIELNSLAVGDKQNRTLNLSVENKVRPVESTDYIKFENPLIQISNPLPNVYAVSFISNHGGQLKPAEIGFMNILDNNGTLYDTISLDRSSSLVDIEDSLETVINFSAEVDHSLTETQVYRYYDNPNAPAAWRDFIKDKLDKYYLSYGADPTASNDVSKQFTLRDEIEFDPGYEPEISSAPGTTAEFSKDSNGMPITGVIFYTYIAKTYTDSWKLTGTPTKTLGSGQSLDITYSYTPKKKVIHHDGAESCLVDLSTDDIINRINEALSSDSRFEDKQFDCFEFGNYIANQSVVLIGTDDPVVITDEYKYKALDGTVTNRLAAVRLVRSKDSVNYKWQVDVLFRCKNAAGIRDTAPTLFIFDLESNIPWSYKYIEEPDTYIEKDFKYYNFTTANVVGTENINYKQLVNYTTGALNVAEYTPSQQWQCLVERYAWLEWIDDELKSVTFTQTSKDIVPPTFTWQFEYKMNNTDYEDGYLHPDKDKLNLFEHFSNPITVKFTTPVKGSTYSATTTTDWKMPIDSIMQFKKLWQWSYKETISQNVVPDIFLDDGTLVSLCQYKPKVAKQIPCLPNFATLVLQAKVTDITNNNFKWTRVGFYDTLSASGSSVGDVNNVPGCVWDASIDLNSNYYRFQMAMANGPGGTSSGSSDQSLQLKWLYDSGLRTTVLEPGALTADSTETNESNCHYYNNQGSISKLYDKFRATINSNGLVSGLSYGDDNYIGTLITDWNSIAEDKYIYFNKNRIGYHSSDGSWYEIKYLNGDGDIDIIFDRYIIINTNGYWNCYDIMRKRCLHYASDFNNRAYAGLSYSEYGSNRGIYDLFISLRADDISTITKYFVSGINSLYEVSQVAITSIQISPQPYLDIIVGKETFCWCKQPARYLPQYIEIFYGDATDNTMAAYQYSTIIYENSSVMLKDSSLVGLNAPVAVQASIQYSPNLFTNFIHTYNNKDLVVNGHFAYPIIYNETTPILSYSSAKQLSNVENIFVIQSQFYGLINGKIVSITYDNYNIIATDAIIDVTGMIYLGYLPTRAFFWSPTDRCIYTFTGDANLDISMEASDISEVYSTHYDPANESLFIVTNIGIVIIAGQQMWTIDVVDVDNLYFIKKGYFIVTHKENNKFISTKYSYEPELLDNPIKRRICVESKYCGPGNGKIANTDSIQLILISDVDEAGEVVFSTSTFTDTGFKSDKKTIKIDKGTWDKGTKAAVINLFPKYQTGQGFKWSIESDFAISAITQSIMEKTGNTLTQLNG